MSIFAVVSNWVPPCITMICKHFCKLDKPEAGQKENGFLNPGLIETTFSGHR